MSSIVRLNREANTADIEMLKLFEESGLATDVVLHGGALRNRALGLEGKIKDYDVWGSFPKFTQLRDMRFPMMMTERLRALPGVSIAKMTGWDPPISGETAGIKFILAWRGREIDLLLDTQNLSIDDKIHHADAPINAVALNSKGELWAHPKHEDHIARRLYAPIPGNLFSDERAANRFDSLSERIPGLITNDRRCVIRPQPDLPGVVYEL